jgi:hypothetical protein
MLQLWWFARQESPETRMQRWIVALVALLIPTFAQAQSYLPLVEGNWWRYLTPDGDYETQTVDGTIELNGASAHVIRYSGGDNDQTENYWTVDPSGDVYLWGFYDPPRGFGFLYDPPILYLDAAPLFLGKGWQTRTRFYTLPDMRYFGTYDIAFEVYEEGVVQVPAGEFSTFGVGPAYPTIPGLAGRTVAGTADPEAIGRSGAGRLSADTWWAEGVGTVQVNSWTFLRLYDYQQMPTPVNAESWGRIKSLFSDEP